MAKNITFTYEGRPYTLEYCRKSVKTMEDRGFSIGDVETKPMSSALTLFSGAFLMHHKWVVGKPELVEEIFDSLTNRQALVSRLVDMYIETLDTLFDKNDEGDDDEGNANWGAND